MKTKYFIYAAFAGIILASCSSNDFAGDQNLLENSGGGGAISFGFDVPTPTRASGADAATKLNSQFIVWGEKGEATSGAAHTADDAGANTHQLVFPNYKVTYTTNSAYTTTSNTKDWEYVGLAYGDEKANIKIAETAVTTDVQTIKFWDYAADSYTFTAVSAKPADISGGKVKINKLTSGTTVYDKGYEVTVTDEADLASLYFADRVKIGDVAADKTGKDRTATNKYGGNVTFTFRNAISQVRVGMYETISGYDVKVTKFYYDADADAADATKPAFADMTDESTTNFVASVPSVSPDVANSKTSVAGTFTVKYYDNTVASIENHPTISFTPTTATDRKQYIKLGTNITNQTKLGETSTTATYDTTDGADTDSDPDYTTVFPQETNAKNLKLKVDYTLYNSVTGETINITGKTAEVPAQYLQWKPNFKYTYLFKITDDELYPITFDAVTIEAADGTVEYITTVTEPSITTFGVKGGKYVTGGSEYAAGSDIYATIMDGSSVADFTFNSQAAGGVNVYLATTTDADKFPITEASVAESLAEIAGSKKITTVLKNSDGTTSFTAAPEKVTTVPGEDGKAKTIKALKLTGAVATTSTTALVVEYIKTPATYHTAGSTFTFADESAFNTEVSTHGKIYTDAAGNTELTWSVYNASDDSKAATYYRRTAVNSVGEYAYKVIRVQ